MRLVRKGLSIEQLGGLIEESFNATLATFRRDDAANFGAA
jgi:hypothetical protein